ncbi:MAG: TolC family protein, partial [Deferribacterota bacterium]|nr:TolC family protein [Deferribacterota bacterium]
EILEEEKSIPKIPENVAVGIPANMIRRRPDIRMAERRLAAQTARIGVAISDLYPKFYIFGTIGLESISSSDFWEGSSKFWSIGPTVNWSIFQGGAIRQNIKVQNERQRQALLNYENTILQALEDVENALTAYAKEQYRFDSLKKSVAAAKRTVLLAMDRYKAGLIDFYNVLDAERALLDLEDQLTSSRGEMVANLARLYKALGGGWEYAKNLENDLTARDALNLDNTTILNSDIYNK